MFVKLQSVFRIFYQSIRDGRVITGVRFGTEKMKTGIGISKTIYRKIGEAGMQIEIPFFFHFLISKRVQNRERLRVWLL